ncbi:hypothetical protein WMY93_021310 [Mugilogobius chulae]|uniref:RING-type domain-containing protein n=1 Tax=Mugilogobius chulae TaxID=88201 RepID=A0AAW0NBI8_9GOBI
MTGAGTGGGGQGPPDGTDPEDAEKCPICLSVLSGVELAMPDSCCHVFCLRCLLTWAELQASPSCPVDRRPFTNVYRWDGHLSCVQVPVRRRVVQPEVESYCRRNSQYKPGLNCKRALRQKKTEGNVGKKSKGLIRKCNDDDPSSLTRKKVRGAESCSWSPPAFISLTETTHEIAQSVDDEEVMLGHRVQRCKPQSCVWFSPAAPSSTCSTRESFHPSLRNTGFFPFALGSSPFSSSPESGSSHFVFEGVVCAITCPKGGEKKGGRSSKVAPKQTAAKRNSNRGAKIQETAPLSDPQSPQTSGTSDSDTPPSAPSRPSRAAQAAGKRKGKRVTNRKASGKRKAPARKKHSAEVISSSSEGEEDTVKNDNTEDEQEVAKPETPISKQDLEKNGEDIEEQAASTEEDLNGDQSNSSPQSDQDKPLTNDTSQDSNNTQDKHDSETQEKTEITSSPLNSDPNSPASTNEENNSVHEEDEAETSSKQEQEEEKLLSSDEKEPSPKQEEMDISDDEDKQSTGAESIDKTELFPQTDARKDDTNEPKTVEDESNDSLRSESQSPRQSEVMCESVDAISHDREEKAMEKDAEKDTKTLTEDLNEVPMDIGSPLSEHGSATPLEKENLCPEASEDKLKDEVSKSDEKQKEEKKEKSPERSRPRRSRFHSPTTSWSPKQRESKDSRRDKRSRSRERNGSPSRSARRSRERERDGDYHRRERDRSRDRSRERRRRRSRSRSRSRSRNRSYRRGDRSPEREERREEGEEERSHLRQMIGEAGGGLEERGESTEVVDLKTGCKMTNHPKEA